MALYINTKQIHLALHHIYVCTLLCPSVGSGQFHRSSSGFNAPHMKLIRVSAHEGGPGSQRCTHCLDQG